MRILGIPRKTIRSHNFDKKSILNTSKSQGQLVRVIPYFKEMENVFVLMFFVKREIFCKISHTLVCNRFRSSWGKNRGMMNDFLSMQLGKMTKFTVFGLYQKLSFLMVAVPRNQIIQFNLAVRKGPSVIINDNKQYSFI